MPLSWKFESLRNSNQSANNLWLAAKSENRCRGTTSWKPICFRFIMGFKNIYSFLVFFWPNIVDSGLREAYPLCMCLTCLISVFELTKIFKTTSRKMVVKMLYDIFLSNHPHSHLFALLFPPSIEVGFIFTSIYLRFDLVKHLFIGPPGLLDPSLSTRHQPGQRSDGWLPSPSSKS